MNKIDHNQAIAVNSEKSMTPEWRMYREDIKDTIRDTVAAVEKLRAEDKVQEGFGIQVTDMGPKPNGNHSVAKSVNAPGLYIGVREGRSEEVSRVVDTGYGKFVYFMRMPSFEPDHSPEVGVHGVQHGVEFEAGIMMFPNDDTGNKLTAIQIGVNDMPERYQETGHESESHRIVRAEELQQSHEWIDHAVARNILATH